MLTFSLYLFVNPMVPYRISLEGKMTPRLLVEHLGLDLDQSELIIVV
ncbi:MAG: hypothetical protein JSU94_06270 [Phycisphaerales bacterium]|nr:MAG: hypothetical protein JSU94_06270 [Phycisphaerales bacterium]